ncbi:B-cell receptor CD22-like [Pyxicephalus adspersus]|uniref:Ig-like domain-containing protein n=1 Tax=Pyxicephalus adspersus TaxID=30357 RepID=A0AAV2ZUW7_PYXAD|nr:TPA: hypothetical protein GDO54_003261 [Pyxicephalus adspersus]
MIITRKVLVLTLFQGLLTECWCQKWDFPNIIFGLAGSCVEIPCVFSPQNNSGTSSTVWYLYRRKQYLEIFNSQKSSSVLSEYRDRTSLARGRKSCSLRIDPVRRDDSEEYYYPGIAEHQRTNAWSLSGMILLLNVTDDPPIPALSGKNRMVEGNSETIECSVWHTCGSSPPSLKYNKSGQTKRHFEALPRGYWREILHLRYVPTSEDDKTVIQCTATYHNGKTSQRAATLNILYAPKDVMVVLPKPKAIIEGGDVILTCFCKSNPPPLTYEWYRANSKVKLRSEDQKSLILRNVSKDTEPYSCSAINEVGRGESPPTRIPMQYAATGVQVIVLYKAGGATRLKCSFVSSKPNVTHYTWFKDGNKLIYKTGQILVLDNNEDMSGSFSCIAHNIVGSSTSSELELEAIDADNNEEGTKKMIYMTLFPVLGFICLSILVICIYCRYKAHQASSPTSTTQEVHSLKNLQCSDANYTDLVKEEVSDYYNSLKPPFPTQREPGGRNVTSDNHYENIIK